MIRCKKWFVVFFVLVFVLLPLNVSNRAFAQGVSSNQEVDIQFRDEIDLFLDEAYGEEDMVFSRPQADDVTPQPAKVAPIWPWIVLGDIILFVCGGVIVWLYKGRRNKTN